MSGELIRCARAIVGGALREDFAFSVRDGKIADVGSFSEVRERAGDLPIRAFPADRLIVPGFINGHSHAYQILLRGWADDRTFEDWRSEALYRVVPELSPQDIYWVFVAAFSEMLAAGTTTVAEFFYLNGRGNAHAEAAIRAASETGIHLVFARAWMDVESAPAAFRETIAQAEERTDQSYGAFPQANVCVAPHSLHAASEAMLRAAGEFARSHDCMLHIHVAEARYEVEQVRATFGTTPVLALDRCGILDGRMIAIHAIYVTEEEKQLLGERGARVIHNPTTNLYLGDGICDVVGLQRAGVTIGLGTDADVKPSIIDEMRAASYLQKVARLDGSALGAGAAYDFGTSQGARALGVAAGDLSAGLAADFLVLDASAIDPWSPPWNALVYRGEGGWVQAAFVGGVRVYTGERSALAMQARKETAAIAKRLGLPSMTSN